MLGRGYVICESDVVISHELGLFAVLKAGGSVVYSRVMLEVLSSVVRRW